MSNQDHIDSKQIEELVSKLDVILERVEKEEPGLVAAALSDHSLDDDADAPPSDTSASAGEDETELEDMALLEGVTESVEQVLAAAGHPDEAPEEPEQVRDDAQDSVVDEDQVEALAQEAIEAHHADAQASRLAVAENDDAFAEALDEASLAAQIDQMLAEHAAGPESPSMQATGLAQDQSDQDDAPAQTLMDQQNEGDRLAEQIQELLDDARAQESEQAGAQAAEVDAQALDELDQAGDFSSPQQVLSEDQGDSDDEDAADEAPAETTATASTAEAAPLEEIDELLAENADEAVAGEFETVTDVLADPQSAMTAEDDPQDDAVLEASDTPDTPDTPEASEDHEPDELELQGAFDAPEEVVATAETVADKPADFAASAEDLAAELDDQPETRPAADAAVQTENAPRATVKIGKVPVPEIHIRADALHRICSLINKPLDRLSAEKKQLIGYIGLVTLGNGTLFCLYALISRVF